MTPARRHRERLIALAADPASVVSAPEGGQPQFTATERTPASAHRDREAAAHIASASASVPAVAAPSAAGADTAARQIGLRLTHDLRRLKEIKAVSLKIEAKRQMIPEYLDWISGLLDADTGVGTGIAAEVAPTIMVWHIDTGDYSAALDIAEFLLGHNATMPARYNRDVATVIVEEIAEAALKAQAAGGTFDTNPLYRVARLTEDIDMHDEVRAKLMKAIGTEGLRLIEEAPASGELRPSIERALADLRTAQQLHDRIGVKDKIKRAEKLLAVNLAAFPPQTEQSGDTAA